MKKLSLLMLAAVFLSACVSTETIQKREIFAMNTVMSLSASGQNADAALEDAVIAINRADRLWNSLQENSEVYKLNHSDGQKVTLSAETMDVLKKALYYANVTGGTFDPTIAPVTQAWDIVNNPRVPPDEELAQLLPLVDYTQVQTEGNEAWFLQSGMQLDLGAIGKGAVSDTVMQMMKSRGVTTALFSLGGNIGVLGRKSDGTLYKIGVRDPDGTQNDMIGYVSLTDRFVVSSGDYERYFMKNGVRYHHIFDPAAGKPVNNGLRQVCIIADNGAKADAYSTALFVMGLDKALAFQKQQGDFEAVFITADKKVIATQGIREVFTFTGEEKGYMYEN